MGVLKHQTIYLKSLYQFQYSIETCLSYSKLQVILEDISILIGIFYNVSYYMVY